MADVDVSVVIATYRREKLLLDAIASALAQTGLVLEVIVVDDSPEGSAGEGVRRLADPRVRYLHRAEPSGGRPGAVRHDGVALARAPLLHFLDDDDRLFDGALRTLADALHTSGSAIAFGRVVPFGDHAVIREAQRAYFQRMAAALRRIRGRHWFTAHLLFCEMPLINSACMIQRAAFDAQGGYDASLRCCEDVDLFLRLARAGGYTFVDQDVLHYRVGEPSIMNELRRTDHQAERDRVRESYEKMHARYKREHGQLEYRALQLFTRMDNLQRKLRSWQPPSSRLL